MSIEKVNLAQKLSLFSDCWRPRIVGELNDSYVKVVKVKGEFVWHKHEREDELFLVVSGRLTIRLRERDIALEPGEFVIVPKGVEHMPVAAEEAHLVLIEPGTTLNTGDVRQRTHGRRARSDLAGAALPAPAGIRPHQGRDWPR